MKKIVNRGLALVGGLSASAVAFAQEAGTGPDLSALTGAVNLGTVVAAVLSIAGALALVYVAVKGAKMGLQMLKGG